MLPTEVIAYAGQLFKCSPRDILNDKRTVRIHRARLACYLAFWTRAELRGTQPSYKGVGRLMGGRDHSTIIHGLKRARALMDSDPEFAQRVLQIITIKEFPNLKEGVEEEACNSELQQLQVPDQQQKEAPVPTPEDTEHKLNDAFKRAGLKALEAYWDGNIPTAADPATFDAYVNGEETDLIVRDHGERFTVLRRMPRYTTKLLGTSDTPSGVVDIVRAQVYDKQKEAA